MATHSSIFAWRIPWTEKPGIVHRVTKRQTQMQRLSTHARTWNTLAHMTGLFMSRDFWVPDPPILCHGQVPLLLCISLVDSEFLYLQFAFPRAVHSKTLYHLKPTLSVSSSNFLWSFKSKVSSHSGLEKHIVPFRFLFTVFCCCFCSVAQSCLTLCNPMDCCLPGFPVLHYLPEFAQTHVHWVVDAVQPFHPLSPPSPFAINLIQHQGLFQ